MDITDILLAIITLISAVITGIVAPWVKAKVGTEKYETGMKWVHIAVAAAEQVYDAVDGDAKKEYAVEFLRSRGICFDEAELDAAIEAEVRKLKSA